MEPIRVSIGTEPSQHIACEVLKSSIIRRTDRTVYFTQSWVHRDLFRHGNRYYIWNTYPGEDWGRPPLDSPHFEADYEKVYDACKGWHPLMRESPHIKQGTKFSTWRWLVPACYGNQGKAIYLDADQIVLADIGELWDELAAGYYFAAVCNAVGIFGKKKTPEPGKVQTSVMVMDCAACPQAPLRATADGSYEYRHLMQANWVNHQRIQELDPAWNHFGIRRPETKLIHFSHVKSQAWVNPEHPQAKLWRKELRASIDAGHVSRADLKAEIKRGHVHKAFKDCL